MSQPSQPQAKKQEKEKLQQHKKVNTYYDIKGEKLVRNLKKCPRCGSFMAHHKERSRWACGSCGYTEYIAS